MSMRMSASSSTINMSCAMADRAQLHGLAGTIEMLRAAGLGGAEDKADFCSFRLGVLQHQLSLVIFHDFFHNGETETSALRPRRHVGLGQLFAVMPWQALAVVFDNNRSPTGCIDDGHTNSAGWARGLLGDSCLDRFDSILEDIDQRLTDEPRIAAHRHGILWENRREGDLGVCGALEKHCPIRDLNEIFRL